MTTIDLQCSYCKNDVAWVITDEDVEKGDDGTLVCKVYSKGIPSYVEEGMQECPKFEQNPEAVFE